MQLRHLSYMTIALGVVGLSGCAVKTDILENSGNGVGLANPASEYCITQGGRLEIRTRDDGGQYGVCILSDGSEIDEWEYYRSAQR